MEHPIEALITKPYRLVIGFMSGTSADGIDAVLAEIYGHGTATRVKQRDFVFIPFAPEVRAEILRLASGGSAAAADFCRMNFLLGELYCEAGRELCRHAGVSKADIDLIGNHGQTFWHIPNEEEYLGHRLRSTLQLGEDAMLAEEFSCPVVGDFRVRDMAAGGLGAPLVPYTEFLLDEIVRSKIDSILSEYYCDDAPEQCMHKALDMLSENRRAVLHVYSSAARDVFDQCLSHACEYWADRFIERYAAGRELDSGTRAFMTYMCRFNCSGLLSDWFIRGMKPDAEPDMHRACTLWAEAAELAHRGAH